MTHTEPSPPADFAVQNTILATDARARTWRLISLALVAIGVIVAGIWILQSRSARDVAAERTRTLDVEATTVTVTGLPASADASVAVLGIDAYARTPLVSGAAELQVPSSSPHVIALFTGSGDLAGMTLVTPQAGQVTPASITPETTATAVLALAPGFLSPDLDRTLRRVGVAEDDSAFADLARAIEAHPDLSKANPDVESILAGILDRLSVAVVPDQGCDSVLDPQAETAVGTCITFGSRGAVISNHQRRWVTLFGTDNPDRPCGAAAPAATPGSEVTIADTCGDAVTLAAPGPTNRAAADPAVAARLHTATAIDQLGSYVLPLVDLGGGGAGTLTQVSTHILGSIESVAAASGRVIEEEPDLGSALDTLSGEATRRERHDAQIAVAEALTSSGEASTMIPNWAPGTSAHQTLLRLYGRVGELMTEPSTIQPWGAAGYGTVDLGASR